MKIRVDSYAAIIPSLELLLKKPIHLFSSKHIIYIFWNDASVPIIKTNLNAALTQFNDIISVGPDTWILNVSLGYIIEFFHEGKITAGLIHYPPLLKTNIFLKCTVLNEAHVVRSLFEELKTIVKHRWPEAKVILKKHTTNTYNNDIKEITYVVMSNTSLLVQEFITIFSVNWNYVSTSACDIYTQQIFQQENAIWIKEKTFSKDLLIPALVQLQVSTIIE